MLAVVVVFASVVVVAVVFSCCCENSYLCRKMLSEILTSNEIIGPVFGQWMIRLPSSFIISISSRR